MPLTHEQVRELRVPPSARAELANLALVMSEWWQGDASDCGDTADFVIGKTEVPPWEADLPTIGPGDLAEITIETAHAPISLTLLVFAGLTDEGGADPNTLVYEISHRTNSTDPEFSISIEPGATVLSIPKRKLPRHMAMAVLQASWHGEPLADGSPLVLMGTWATYVK